MASNRLDKLKNIKVIIDPSLDKYKGRVLFPEKLARANEALKNVQLPKEKKKGN